MVLDKHDRPLSLPTIQPKPNPQEQKPPTFLFLPINLSNSKTTNQRSQAAPPQQNLNPPHRQCSTPRLLSRPALRPEEAKHRRARRQLVGSAAVDERLIGWHSEIGQRQNSTKCQKTELLGPKALIGHAELTEVCQGSSHVALPRIERQRSRKASWAETIGVGASTSRCSGARTVGVSGVFRTKRSGRPRGSSTAG